MLRRESKEKVVTPKVESTCDTCGKSSQIPKWVFFYTNGRVSCRLTRYCRGNMRITKRNSNKD